MTQPSTLSLEMRLKVSSGSSQALHPYGVAGTWDQSQSRVEMWEWLVTDNLQVARTLAGMWSKETQKIASPSKVKGISSHESEKGVRKYVSGQLNRKHPVWVGCQESNRGSFWPSWDGRAEQLGKHQIWKESNLHSSIAWANFLLFKMENQMKKTAKCWINVRNDSISLEKAPSHRNSWEGLPPWTETPSPL